MSSLRTRPSLPVPSTSNISTFLSLERWRTAGVARAACFPLGLAGAAGPTAPLSDGAGAGFCGDAGSVLVCCDAGTVSSSDAAPEGVNLSNVSWLTSPTISISTKGLPTLAMSPAS
jgi:hypothetical protein